MARRPSSTTSGPMSTLTTTPTKDTIRTDKTTHRLTSSPTIIARQARMQPQPITKTQWFGTRRLHPRTTRESLHQRTGAPQITTGQQEGKLRPSQDPSRALGLVDSQLTKQNLVLLHVEVLPGINQVTETTTSLGYSLRKSRQSQRLSWSITIQMEQAQMWS